MSEPYDGWENFSRRWLESFGVEYSGHTVEEDDDKITVNVRGICKKPLNFILLEVKI